jgi:4-amino-4-deoxy-L-arabinose transferase-like glycosyltransferase
MTEAPALNRPLLAALAGFKLVLHLLLANGYGYFRDELYFLDCGRHLAFGYVDHAPFIALVSRAALAMGGSLMALRVFPAVAGAMLVALAMLIAWRLGGGAFAQALAGLAVIAAPVFLGIHGILT